MLNKYNTDISNIFKNHRRRLVLRPLLAALSILVVLSTAYMLMQPGVTLEAGELSGQAGQVQNTGNTPSASATAASATVVPVTDVPAESDTQTSESAADVQTTYMQSTESVLAATVMPSSETSSEPSSASSALSADPTADPTAESSAAPSVAPTVTPTVTPATEYSYENATISVKAVLSENAVIPADAQFQVLEITEESDPQRYSEFQKLLEPVTDAAATDTVDSADSTSDSTASTDSSAAAPADTSAAASNVPDLVAYDIGFYVDGVEVEPTGGSVQVTIDYKSPLIDAALAGAVSIYHVVETDSSTALETVQDVQSVLSDEGALESITFATDSFSPFIIPNGVTMSSSLHYLLIDQVSKTFTNTSYYNAANPLGIAGNFHVVAFDTATLTSHTNGNILAKNLSTTSNFGTKNYGVELSYIQNYLQINGGSSADVSDILAVGSSNTVSLVDNGGSFAITTPNGITTTKIDYPQNIWQDSNTATLPFIDFAAVKTQISDIAALLKSQPNSNITPSTTDINDTSLTLASSAVLGVYNLTADQLASYANGMNVYSFTPGSTDTVIINIDCAGKTNVTVPNIRMFMDGYTSKDNYVVPAEINTFQSGKIILNFVNSSNVNITLKQTYASVIAPDANLYITQNLNGTIIGKNVYIQAESHRTDFTGSLPTGTVTAKKEWYASDGTTLLPAASTANLSVSVQLYCNNAAMSGSTYTVTLNSANNWTTTWSNLPVSAGQKYTVKELSISKSGTVIQTGETPAAYSVAYTNNAGIMNGTITVRNTEPDLKVDKLWKDSLGNTIVPGASGVTVTLLRRTAAATVGETVQTVTLNAANGWSYGWFGLPQTNAGGEALYYYVTETQVGGYAITYTNNSGIRKGSITVTNTKGKPYVLPATGGSGTSVLYAAGAAILLSVFLMTGLKMRFRKRKGGTSSA